MKPRTIEIPAPPAPTEPWEVLLQERGAPAPAPGSWFVQRWDGRGRLWRWVGPADGVGVGDLAQLARRGHRRLGYYRWVWIHAWTPCGTAGVLWLAMLDLGRVSTPRWLGAMA